MNLKSQGSLKKDSQQCIASMKLRDSITMQKEVHSGARFLEIQVLIGFGCVILDDLFMIKMRLY